MTRSGAAGHPAALILSLWLSLSLSSSACNGHLDFGAKTGSEATCAADADCGLSGLHCDLAGSRTCVACVSDTQCTVAGASHCDPVTHRCVACVLTQNCATTETCVGNRCLTRCQEDNSSACPTSTSCHSGVCGSCGDDDSNACAAVAATPFCVSSFGRCVACRTDLDCTAGQPHCDPLNKACVECVSGADCSAAAPFCDPGTGTCSAG